MEVLNQTDDSILCKVVDVSVIAVAAVALPIVLAPIGLTPGPRGVINQTDDLQTGVSCIIHDGVVVAQHKAVPGRLPVYEAELHSDVPGFALDNRGGFGRCKKRVPTVINDPAYVHAHGSSRPGRR